MPKLAPGQHCPTKNHYLRGIGSSRVSHCWWFPASSWFLFTASFLHPFLPTPAPVQPLWPHFWTSRDIHLGSLLPDSPFSNLYTPPMHRSLGVSESSRWRWEANSQSGAKSTQAFQIHCLIRTPRKKSENPRPSNLAANSHYKEGFTFISILNS